MTEATAERAGEPPELVLLHTAAVHVHTFDALLRELQPHVRARHVVRQDLLAAAQHNGTDDPSSKTSVAAAVANLDAAPGSVVLCTCSTIGGLAESAATSTRARAIRVDRAMSEKAVAAGPNILVAAALASTLAPTQALTLEAACRAGVNARVTRLVVDDAWRLFEQGDFDAYLRRIADALNKVVDCDVVVLAQASMAGAAERCPVLSVPVLSSPRLGLESALAASDASVARRQSF